MPPNPGDPGLWAEHGGLIGLIIAALFLIILAMGGAFVWAFKQHAAERLLHKAERESDSKLHRDERDAWRTDHKELASKGDKQNEKLQNVVSALTEAVKDLGRK